VSAEDKRLERQQQRLRPQNQCVHQPERVHRVQRQPLEEAVSFAAMMSWLLD
jgi:hypothetical protein